MEWVFDLVAWVVCAVFYRRPRGLDKSELERYAASRDLTIQTVRLLPLWMLPGDAGRLLDVDRVERVYRVTAVDPEGRRRQVDIMLDRSGVGPDFKILKSRPLQA